MAANNRCRRSCPCVITDQVWERVWSRSLALLVLADFIYLAYFSTVVFVAPECADSLEFLIGTPTTGAAFDASVNSTLTVIDDLRVPSYVVQAGYLATASIANTEYISTYWLPVAAVFAGAYTGISTFTRLLPCITLASGASVSTLVPAASSHAPALPWITRGSQDLGFAPIIVVVVIGVFLWVINVSATLVLIKLCIQASCGRLRPGKRLRDRKVNTVEPPPSAGCCVRVRGCCKVTFTESFRVAPLRMLVAASASFMAVLALGMRVEGIASLLSEMGSKVVADVEATPESNFPAALQVFRAVMLIVFLVIQWLAIAVRIANPLSCLVVLTCIWTALYRHAGDHRTLVAQLASQSLLDKRGTVVGGTAAGGPAGNPWGADGGASPSAPAAMTVPISVSGSDSDAADTSRSTSSTTPTVVSNPFLAANRASQQQTATAADATVHAGPGGGDNQSASADQLPERNVFASQTTSSRPQRRPSRLSHSLHLPAHTHKIWELSTFDHTAAFSYVTMYIGTIILVQALLTIFFALPLFVILFPITREYVLTAIGTAAGNSIVVSRLSSWLLQWWLINPMTREIKRPRWFLVADFLYTYTVGALNGVTMAAVRVLLHVLWSLMRATYLNRSLYPRPFTFHDSGYWAHGSMLMLAYGGQPPPFIDKPRDLSEGAKRFGADSSQLQAAYSVNGPGEGDDDAGSASGGGVASWGGAIHHTESRQAMMVEQQQEEMQQKATAVSKWSEPQPTSMPSNLADTSSSGEFVPPPQTESTTSSAPTRAARAALLGLGQTGAVASNPFLQQS